MLSFLFISCGTSLTNSDKDTIKVKKIYERFETGQLKEVGEYEIWSYTNCCMGGLCENIYNYKLGYWMFYYETGELKAKGKFILSKFHVVTSCEDGDEIVFGVVNDSWEYYDENTNNIEPKKEMFFSIESTKSNGDFQI